MSTTNVTDPTQIVNAALEHHKAGRLPEAEALYQQALGIDPNHPEALHLLGVIWHQTGRSGQALNLVQRAVSIRPTFANLNNLGEVLRSFGRTPEAVACFNRALQLDPNCVDAYANLALAMIDLGRPDDAEKCLTRACQLAPNRADWHLHLCMLRHAQGDFHGAVAAAKRAVDLTPNSPQSWANYALALSHAKKFDASIDAAQRAVALGPDHAEIHNNLGSVLERAGQSDQAETQFQRAVELNPNLGLAHRNLAALYDNRGDIERAIPALLRTLELMPNDVEAWVNLSNLQRRRKEYKAAVESADRALALNPAAPNAHGSRGLALLALGDYQKGLVDYEWRWRCPDFTSPPREFAQPMWDGSDPSGRKILIHSEQGFGDTIQFARYVPMLAVRGATIYFEVIHQLRSLMVNTKGVQRVIPAGTKPPDFDLHVPLLSLPRIFGTTLENIPHEVPYLFASESRLAKWKSKIESIGATGKKIGLVWAGNIKPEAARTCPLENFAPLANVQNATFFSLQSRENPRADDAPPPGMKLIDLASDLKDFEDTAAAMMNLDLIITIDTASAHLSGALGRPTWVLVPWAADWRWLEDREDSPWYPTVRIFRQTTRGDWASVGQRVGEELRKSI